MFHYRINVIEILPSSRRNLGRVSQSVCCIQSCEMSSNLHSSFIKRSPGSKSNSFLIPTPLSPYATPERLVCEYPVRYINSGFLEMNSKLHGPRIKSLLVLVHVQTEYIERGLPVEATEFHSTLILHIHKMFSLNINKLTVYLQHYTKQIRFTFDHVELDHESSQQ